VSKALYMCSGVGCGELVARGRCKACEAKHKQERKPAEEARGEHVNAVPNWRRIRGSYLRRHTSPVTGQPMCECGECERLPVERRQVATDVHHVVDRADGGRSTDSNLKQLSHSHHALVTNSRIVRAVGDGS
jgi:hypothetical protein